MTTIRTGQHAPGRTSAKCAATRHGTHRAYASHGCRCPNATERYRLYRKALRENTHPRHLIAAHGANRRLLALYAAGYETDDLARRLGVHPETVAEHMRFDHPSITRPLDDRIRGLYQRIAYTPGPSQQCREAAKARGIPGPLAWATEDIDDPAAGHQALRAMRVLAVAA